MKKNPPRWKKILLGMIIFGAGWVLPTCISFRTPALPTPENILEEMVVCRNVLEQNGLLVAGDTPPTFGPGEPALCCYVRLRGVAEDLRLHWKWYDPEGRLARESEEIDIHPGGKYFDVVTAYDRLEFDREVASRPEGEWTVALFLNGAFAGKIIFRITASPPQTSSGLL